MRLIVVSDIYGKTNCLEDLLSCFSQKYQATEIIDPYEGTEIDFKNEQEAYQYFLKYIGVDGYIGKLYQYLKNNSFPEYHLLGFSVGASAIWAVSQMLEFKEDTKGICFYGSQIRNFLEIHPKFKIDLYFPKEESHFNVDKVIAALNEKNKVSCFKTSFLHGFMNKKSKNYNESGFTEYIERLRLRLS